MREVVRTFFTNTNGRYSKYRERGWSGRGAFYGCLNICVFQMELFIWQKLKFWTQCLPRRKKQRPDPHFWSPRSRSRPGWCRWRWGRVWARARRTPCCRCRRSCGRRQRLNFYDCSQCLHESFWKRKKYVRFKARLVDIQQLSLILNSLTFLGLLSQNNLYAHFHNVVLCITSLMWIAIFTSFFKRVGSFNQNRMSTSLQNISY